MAKTEHRGPRAHKEVQPELPPGVKLLRTLEGHQGYIRSVSWLVFALMTGVSWGLYGVFSPHRPVGYGLFVGLAYFLTAVLAPLIVLKLQGAAWTFPTKGAAWSLIAGIVDATEALCVPAGLSEPKGRRRW